MPSFTQGATDGFKLLAVVPGSLFARLGLQNGDVIRRVGGVALTSVEGGLELFQRLRSATRVELELERRGQPLRQRYAIE